MFDFKTVFQTHKKELIILAVLVLIFVMWYMNRKPAKPATAPAVAPKVSA